MVQVPGEDTAIDISSWTLYCHRGVKSFQYRQRLLLTVGCIIGSATRQALPQKQALGPTNQELQPVLVLPSVVSVHRVTAVRGRNKTQIRLPDAATSGCGGSRSSSRVNTAPAAFNSLVYIFCHLSSRQNRLFSYYYIMRPW